MLSADQEAAARAILASLRREIWSARASLASTWGYNTAGIGGALDAVEEHLKAAETTWLERVRSGEKGFGWWLTFVDEQRAAVSQYAGTLESGSHLSNAWKTVEATASDVVEGVKTLAPEINSTAKWLVVGLVALVVLKVLKLVKL